MNAICIGLEGGRPGGRRMEDENGRMWVGEKGGTDEEAGFATSNKWERDPPPVTFRTWAKEN